jgi:hypothetical protein
MGVILDHLGRVPTLTTLGRGGSFFHGHVHDFIAAGFAAAPVVARFARRVTEAPGKPLRKTPPLDDSVQIGP